MILRHTLKAMAYTNVLNNLLTHDSSPYVESDGVHDVLVPFKGQQFLPGICVPDFEREKEEEEEKEDEDEEEEEEEVSSTHLSATARQHTHKFMHITPQTHTHTPLQVRS